MITLKSWLARKAARLVVSDPEAVKVIADAMPKPAGVTPRELLRAIAEAERRWG